MKKLPHSLYFLLLTAGIILAGAVLGAVSFPLVGRLLGVDMTLDALAWKGVKTLAFFFFLWAPGIALVLSVKRVYESKRAAGEVSDSDTPTDASD